MYMRDADRLLAEALAGGAVEVFQAATGRVSME